MKITVDLMGGGLGIKKDYEPITPKTGYVFLLATVDILPVVGRKVLGGRDVYLVDGGGEKNVGYLLFSDYWMEFNTETTLNNNTKLKFLYL